MSYVIIGTYLNRLWESCGLVSKPQLRYESGPQWEADRYKGWLHQLHKRKELQGMIEGLRGVGL